MGDPKRQRKKYETPKKPWERLRLEKEHELISKYGLKNKKGLWKAESRLRRHFKQAKRVIASPSEQTKKEEKQLISKLSKYGYINVDAKVEDILNLNISNVLDRRLQSIVHLKGLSNSPKQARQLITHGHIRVNNRKVDIPSYIVTKEEEATIEFDPNSRFSKDLKEKIAGKKESKVVQKEKKAKKVKKQNEKG